MASGSPPGSPLTLCLFASLPFCLMAGITIEMESCTGGASGIHHCSDALEGQRAATLAAGREPVSVLWMTHSESMSAAQQCTKVASLQELYPWVQAGTDFFDGSHVLCNSSSG